MASDDDEEFDNGLKADMEAVRRALLLDGGGSEDDFFGDGAAAATTSDPSSPETDDGEDDVERFHEIEKRFALSTELHLPFDMDHLSSFLPAADDDDFETLRAIERRFASYNDETKIGEFDKELHKAEQVGATKITSEEGFCNNFFLERTNAGEGFPTCVDGNNGDLQISEACSWNSDGAENASPQSSGFPKSAQAFVDVINKNRAMQKLIQNKMIHIEARIEELKRLKDNVKTLKDFQASCRKRTGRALAQKMDPRVQLISIPRQKFNPELNERKSSALYYGPPENSIVDSYRDALLKIPVCVNREKWSEEERGNLLKGVKQQFQETMLNNAIDLRSDMDESFGDVASIDSNISLIKELDITPEMMRLFLPKVNWDRLASMYIPRRSGAECQTRWLNWEDPLINNERWRRLEEKKLLCIVRQKGLSNWFDIAISLGTNRTPFDCLAHYQRSLNNSIIKSQWTEEDDDKLRAAVEIFGEGNWQAVAASLEERTGTQCSNRWKKSLHPSRVRVGKWNADEDKRLMVAMILFGQKLWKEIAQYVPGRLGPQCRERWVNNLDPSLNLNKWTEEEDLKLKAAIEEHGYSWSKVAACVPPRTDSQCRRRWIVLCPDEVPLLQEAKKIQKTAFISNFVDRESERPSLKPDDFAPMPLLLQTSQSETTSKKRKRASRNLSSNDSEINNGMEVENCRDGITPNKGKRSKRQQKSKTSTGRGKRPLADQDMLNKGNEPLESDVATQKKRTSKLAPRKKGNVEPCEEVPEVFVSDEIETASGNAIMFKGSTKQDSSSLPNSTSNSTSEAIKSKGRVITYTRRKKCNSLSLSQENCPVQTSCFSNKRKSNGDGGGNNKRKNASSHKGEDALEECSVNLCISEVEIEDDMPLAHFLSKLKRKVEPATGK